MRAKKPGFEVLSDFLSFLALSALSAADWEVCTFFSFSAILITLSFLSAVQDALLRLVVDGVLLAEGAILVQLKTVGGILLVFHGVVVSLLALRAPQGDLDASAGLTCHVFGTSF